MAARLVQKSFIIHFIERIFSMDILTVKKKDYEIVKVYDEYTMKVQKDGVLYFANLLGYKTRAYSNFMFAYKRLNNANVTIPKRLVVDKKRGIVLSEFISGKTVFEELSERDLEDIYYAGTVEQFKDEFSDALKILQELIYRSNSRFLLYPFR